MNLLQEGLCLQYFSRLCLTWCITIRSWSALGLWICACLTNFLVDGAPLAFLVRNNAAVTMIRNVWTTIPSVCWSQADGGSGDRLKNEQIKPATWIKMVVLDFQYFKWWFFEKNSFQNPAENTEFLADFRRCFSGNWGGFMGTGIRAAE